MQTDSLQSLPLPIAFTPSSPESWDGGEHRVGETKVWMGKKERKIQLNYHCFNIEISLISLMLAETKFITLLHSGKVQGGAWRLACLGLVMFREDFSPSQSMVLS